MKTEINILPSVIALNINGLNFSIRGHRLVECSKRQNPTFLLFIKTLLTFKDRYNLRTEVWKNLFQANGTSKVP